MAGDSSALSEVDKLRLQLSEAKAQIALLSFECEKLRLFKDYGLGQGDKLDLATGLITRGQRDG